MHIKSRTLLLLVSPAIILFAVAFILWGIAGLPQLSQTADVTSTAIVQPPGFSP